MSFNFIPSSLKEKLENLSFSDEDKNILSCSFSYFSSDFVGRTKLEESINLLVQKLERKEKTFTVIDSNVNDMEIEVASPAQPSNPKMEEGWLKPSRRKSFRKPSTEKNKAPPEKKTKKQTNPIKTSWAYNWPKARTFWLRSEKIMELSTDIVDKIINEIQDHGNCKIEHFVRISGQFPGIKFATVGAWHSPSTWCVNDCNFVFWRPSMIRKQIVISRVPQKLRKDSQLADLIRQSIIDCGLQVIEVPQVQQLRRKTEEGYQETSSIKISGLEDSVSTLLLKRGFLSLKNRAMPIRLFHWKR